MESDGNRVREQWARLMERQGWSVYANSFERTNPDADVKTYKVIDGRGYRKPDLILIHRYHHSPVPADPTRQAHLVAERYDEVTYKQTATWTITERRYDLGFEQSLTRDYLEIQRHDGIRVLWIVRELHEPVDPYANKGFYGLGEHADEPAEGTWLWIAVEDVPRLGRLDHRYSDIYYVPRAVMGRIELLPTPSGLPPMAEVLEAEREVIYL